ncbi:MAG: FtsW/RodA/SpoVE family cell cycle protein [Bacteroidetes bacterium]|nr:FtsW/RodA/SpoVE family cell cycle protein [Bacteroidota bacterium]
MQQILQKLRGDRAIWSVVLILTFFSLLAVYSSTRSLAFKLDKNATYYLVKQLSVLAAGLVIIFLVHRVNYTVFAKLSVLAYLVSIPLLAYTLFFGTTYNNGSRWIRLPVVNLTFQTSDFAKLVLFMFLARLLSQKQGSIKDLRKGFLPVLIPVLLTCALIAPANLSTALMLGATCCILFFIGRVNVKHIAMLALAGVFGVIMLFAVSKLTGFGRAATWEKRIADFRGGTDSTGQKAEEPFQGLQAKIAIANGGVWGRGPGHSMQRDFLPEAYSDFIFSSIIEEYGLVGGGVLIFLYLAFLWRSILIFRRCPYAFGAFLAVGLSITLVFQAMLNMAVNVHLVPVTGLTLPMVSMGGSSIWFTSIAIGIVLSVSRYVDEMEGKDGMGNTISDTTGSDEDDDTDGDNGGSGQPEQATPPTDLLRKAPLPSPKTKRTLEPALA